MRKKLSTGTTWGGGGLKLCSDPETTCITKVFNKTEISITSTTENGIRRVPNPRRSNFNPYPSNMVCCVCRTNG